jgi:hypothetical protein
MGIGDWGLGIGDWGLGPIPNPQSPSPIPNTQWNNIGFLFYKKFIWNSYFKLKGIKNKIKYNYEKESQKENRKIIE